MWKVRQRFASVAGGVKMFTVTCWFRRVTSVEGGNGAGGGAVCQMLSPHARWRASGGAARLLRAQRKAGNLWRV